MLIKFAVSAYLLFALFVWTKYYIYILCIPIFSQIYYLIAEYIWTKYEIEEGLASSNPDPLVVRVQPVLPFLESNFI